MPKKYIKPQIYVLLIVMFSTLLFLYPKEDKAASCDAQETYPVPVLSVETTNDGLKLDWEKIEDSRFVQYVIVASKTSNSPFYSSYGYLKKFDNPDVLTYTIDGTESYNNGDFTFINTDESYHFALSVEYDCGLVTTSEGVSATFPDLNPPDLINPTMRLSVYDDGSLLISWDKIEHDNFQDYRVVISRFDSSPAYPENGYLAIISDPDTTSFKIDNSTAYNDGDFDYLEKLHSYYFSVTARFTVGGDDYHTTSNSQRYSYVGPSSNATDYTPTPVITKIVSDENGTALTWDAIDDTRLTNYQIIINKQSRPVYPYSGFLETLDTGTTNYVVNNSLAYHNGVWGEYLEYGESYYFAVVAIYGDEGKVSQSYLHQYVGNIPPSNDEHNYLNITAQATEAGIQLFWDKINDARLVGYKVVLSKDDSAPAYPGHGYYTDVVGSDGQFNQSLNYFLVKGGIANKDGDFDMLSEGETYYVTLAAMLSDGTVINSNSQEFVYQGDDGNLPGTIVIPPSVSDNVTDEVVQREQQNIGTIDTSLTNRLKGRILLQVESLGEAWYIDHDSGQKFYLKDREVAFSALRKFGLGITNADLEKIPVGVEERFPDIDSDGDGLPDKLEEGLGTDPNVADSDGDGFVDGTEILSGYSPLGGGKLEYNSDLVNRLQGRILLQVESRGEAWYLNPADGKRYYMKDGEAAYSIMRFLSLGITNTDLRKIAVGTL